MANRTYVGVIVESATGWGVALLRDPATLPVDTTTPSPTSISARVPITKTRGTGFNGPNASGSNTPTKISSATAATPIVATLASTAASLGIAVGDYVYIQGGLGDLNINGTFEVSVVSGSAITLKGSATAGTYTASSAYCTKLNKADNWQEALHSLTLALANDKVANN